ncbi:MAG: tRNA (adenosine(37)-N6)-threonylcarbamoyltransferase complex ATPase subunit type 1 TsaE, partial [Deltaproteobacteria bacterium]|nr:tRNA (adenosine(37)-N6)-threonylcarbamoyltransferase complex ATPase subunit type 1 TsaE [Deltaproteobacteria bacterium]
FTIINQYNAEHLKLIHLDIYRLSTFEELILAGFESHLKNDSVIMIEWFDKFSELMEYPHIRIEFEYTDESVRRLKFSTGSDHYRKILKQI